MSLLKPMIEGTDYETLLNMTDEQAAEILENTFNCIIVSRGNNKTFLTSVYIVALVKAIKKLRGKEG